MFKLITCFAVLAHVVLSAHIEKRQVTDNGDHIIICKQEPIDFGIVLDSSASINVGSIYNFKKGLAFLQNVLNKFDIGDGRNQVRASIIPFAFGVYRDQSFGLDRYEIKDDLLKAIGDIKYKSGRQTDTDLGIDYMRDHLLTPEKTRSYAEKISIVLTDGDSKNKPKTKAAAEKARAAGITIFAVGVGRVKQEELENIAGDPSRVIKVSSYNDLNDQVNRIAKMTCIRKEKPTTTPPPPTPCGEENPADINFVFSPADLGLDDTVWTTSFVSHVVNNEDMEVGFRFGAVTGSCPEDAGFALKDYTNAREIDERLLEYERNRMDGLVQRTIRYGYREARGGRPNARDIAVISVTEENAEDLQLQIDALLAQNIQVFVVDPRGSGNVSFRGASMIRGSDAYSAAQHMVSMLCEPAR